MTEPTILQRLRAAQLRPTMARIGVLQVIEAAAPASICAEDVFRGLLQRGTPVSGGTVYRALQQCEAAGLLLREWDGKRKAHYRAKPNGFDAAPLRLVCIDTGRTIVLDDAELHARLIAAARREGLDLTGQALAIHAECERSLGLAHRTPIPPTHAHDRHRMGATRHGAGHLRRA